MSDRRARGKRIFVGAAAVTALTLLVGGLLVARADRPDDRGPDAAVPGLVEVDRRPAPQLAGHDPITGERVALSDFAGRPVVVNVWASWCPGCHEEAADLRRFAEAHPDVVVLGIDIQDTEAGARGFYERWGWRHASIFDASGALAAELGLQGLPTTYFLDADHRLAARIVGETDFDGFVAGLERATREL